jgi:hypothetical protein
MPQVQQEIHVGALDPYQFVLILESSGEWDLSLVVSLCAFEVLDEDKFEGDADAIRLWTAVPSNARLTEGGSEVTLTHVYEDGDVPEIGTLRIRARLTHPSYARPIYSDRVKLVVVSGFSG